MKGIAKYATMADTMRTSLEEGNLRVVHVVGVVEARFIAGSVSKLSSSSSSESKGEQAPSVTSERSSRMSSQVVCVCVCEAMRHKCSASSGGLVHLRVGQMHGVV